MSRSRNCSILHNNTVVVHIGAGKDQADHPSLFLSEILPASIRGDIERMNQS